MGSPKKFKLETRFRDKKNKEDVEWFEQKSEELQEWFAEQWPEVDIRINVIFSRVMSEPLQIQKGIAIFKGRYKTFVKSTLTINRYTWINPYSLEKHKENFVDDQKTRITELMEMRGTVYAPR